MTNMRNLKFKIETLVTRTAIGYLTPKSKLDFALNHMETFDLENGRIAKVLFPEQYKGTFQFPEGWNDKPNEILIIGHQLENDTYLSLWVDTGSSGIPIASLWRSDMYLATTQSYRTVKFLQSLTEAEIREIFEFILDHPETIAPKQ
jgi:hypothetical protein